MVRPFWPADLIRELTAPSGGSFPYGKTLGSNLNNYCSVAAFLSDIHANMAFQTRSGKIYAVATSFIF